MNKRRTVFGLVALWVAIAALAFAFQGSRSLWGGDEGRYTAGALEMLRTKSITRIQLADHIPHYTKPPLTYALIAISVAVFGKNEWAARTPHALAMIGTCGVVYALTRLIRPDRAWLAALIFATAPLSYAGFHVITTDALLTFWTAAAMLFFTLAILRDADGRLMRFVYPLAGWIMLALANLTKGPIALVLTLVPLLAWLKLREANKGWESLRPSVGIPVFLILGFGWYLWVALKNPALLTYWIDREIVGRITSIHPNHFPKWYQGFTVYGASVLGGFFPWILWPLGSLWRTRWKWLKPSFWHQLAKDHIVTALFALWVVIPLLFFFLIPSRSHLYVLPLFVPLSVLTSICISDELVQRPSAKCVFLVWVLFLIGARAYAAYAFDFKRDFKPLAHAINAIAKSSNEEITFVGVRTIPYGIRFYHDGKLDAVALDGRPLIIGSNVRLRPLSTKLRAGETSGIFLVKDIRQQEFVETLAKLGHGYEALGGYGDLAFYRIVPEVNPTHENADAAQQSFERP